MMLSVFWYSSVDYMVQNLPGGWFTMSLSVVSIIVLALALLYMVSKIFSVPTLNRRIKEEFFQLGATLVILLMLVSVEYTMESSGGLLYGTDQKIEDLMSSMTGFYVVGGEKDMLNPFDVSYVYLISSLDCIKEEMKQSAEYVNERETFMYLGLTGVLDGVSIPVPIRNIFVWTDYWNDILDRYVKTEENMWLALAGYFQINLLQWIEASMFAIYLPLGILLRSIPFTRGGGAAIMAIAITSYFFYPFFLGLFYFNGPQLPSTCSVDFEYEPAPVPDDEKRCPLDPTAVLSIIEGDSESSSSGPKIPVLDVSGMSRIRMYTYYYPFLAMLICVIIVRALAQILGGNISDIGRGMVRVI
jgi:hypothetical protein